MKFENVLNLVAVAVIAAHLGKKSQEKKEQATKTVRYTSYSDYLSRKPCPSYGRKPVHMRPDDIIFVNRQDAEQVLTAISDISVKYGYVTMADLYELCSLPTTFKDNKFGWKSLTKASIKRTRYGYILVLPAPVEVE